MARRLIPAIERPAATSIVANWLVTEWAHLYPGWDLDAAISELLDVGPVGRPPLTWLLVDDDATNQRSDNLRSNNLSSESEAAAERVIGSVGLALDGELGEPIGTGATVSGIWVVNLFVTPTARGRGYGSELLDHAVDYARRLEIDELLLTTEHSGSHYRSKGWTEIGSTLLNGHESVVMSRPVVAR
jgi:GNAT superfamily N-acetyltransferase